MNRRLQRVNELLRKELSQILVRELNDPRVPPMVTITRVNTSVDLHYARVFVSVMGDSEEKLTAVTTLQSAAGFLRQALKPHLALRHIPALAFSLDESLEEGARMLQAIDELSSTKESS